MKHREAQIREMSAGLQKLGCHPKKLRISKTGYNASNTQKTTLLQSSNSMFTDTSQSTTTLSTERNICLFCERANRNHYGDNTSTIGSSSEGQYQRDNSPVFQQSHRDRPMSRFEHLQRKYMESSHLVSEALKTARQTAVEHKILPALLDGERVATGYDLVRVKARCYCGYVPCPERD
jgi:hypothetical protein